MLAPGRRVTWGRPLTDASLVPVAVAGGLALVSIVLGWRGSDLPAHVFRVELVERDGLEVWNNYWYGGHHTLGYGVLFPLLGATFGLWTVAVASAAVSALLADQLLRGALGRPCWPASLWFAAGTVTNVAIGRLPFALGLTVGLGALLAAQRGRLVVAGLLTAVTAAASPVVSAFLAIVFVAWFLVSRGHDRQRAAALVALAVMPVAIVTLLYPQGGTFPFRIGALVLTVLVCALVGVIVPREQRLVRATCALYAVASVAVFLVPSPLGANITRFGMYAAAPTLLALAPRGLRRVALLPVLALVAFWQWSPAFDAMFRAADDPSTRQAYFRPLLEYLDRASDEVARVEVVPTARHWEAAYVAPNVPIARGWERQLDMRFNPIFYGDDGPTDFEYFRWLHENGVEFVALPDARLDGSGVREAELLASDLPFLRHEWSGEHWDVWSVVGATGMVDGEADLVELDTDSMVLDVREPGDVLIRIRSSAFWSSDPPLCIEPTDDGWIVLRDVPRGRLEVFLDEAEVVDLDDPCAAE